MPFWLGLERAEQTPLGRGSVLTGRASSPPRRAAGSGPSAVRLHVSAVSEGLGRTAADLLGLMETLPFGLLHYWNVLLPAKDGQVRAHLPTLEKTTVLQENSDAAFREHERRLPSLQRIWGPRRWHGVICD